MREIKFRIYDKKLKKVYALKEYQDLHAIEVETDGTLILSPRYRFMDSMMIDIDAFDVQEFTGLHDENGKEIYEGDIVKFKHRDKTIMAPVKYGEWQESKCDEYDCPHYGYYIDYKWDNYCENTGFDLYEKIVEVVGNIYENPELLKGADNIE